MSKAKASLPNTKKPKARLTSQDPDEQVGYGRPPKAYRFKPGESGNPRGRKRGSRNLRSDLADELAEIITVQEAGHAARLTKQRALVKRLCAQALSGEHRAMAQVVGLVLRLIPSQTSDDESGALVEEDDEAIIRRFLARAQQNPTARQRKPTPKG